MGCHFGQEEGLCMFVGYLLFVGIWQKYGENTGECGRDIAKIMAEIMAEVYFIAPGLHSSRVACRLSTPCVFPSIHRASGVRTRSGLLPAVC